MTKFEEAVKLIAEEYREDCELQNCTIRDLFRCWQFDSEDMMGEFWSILNEKFSGDFTDECEVVDDDGDLKTFGRLVTAVRNYKF